MDATPRNQCLLLLNTVAVDSSSPSSVRIQRLLLMILWLHGWWLIFCSLRFALNGIVLCLSFPKLSVSSLQSEKGETIVCITVFNTTARTVLVSACWFVFAKPNQPQIHSFGVRSGMRFTGDDTVERERAKNSKTRKTVGVNTPLSLTNRHHNGRPKPRKEQ